MSFRIIAFCAFLLASFAQGATLDCAQAEGKFAKLSLPSPEETNIDALSALESDLSWLSQRANTPELQQEARALQASFETHLDGWLALDKKSFESSSELHDLKQKAYLAKQQILHQSSQAALTAPEAGWQTIVEHPEKINPDHWYDVPAWSDGQSIRVIFSQEIVDTFFRTQDPIRQRAGHLFLRSIAKGRTNGPGNAGIKKLQGNANKEAYSVTIVGSNMKFRIGGFFVHNEFHLVYQSDRSDHTSPGYVKSFLDSVNKAAVEYRSSHPEK